jgi:hypothetical protein
MMDISLVKDFIYLTFLFFLLEERRVLRRGELALKGEGDLIFHFNGT